MVDTSQIAPAYDPLVLPRVVTKEGKKAAPRAYCVGMTDSGKSTLMQVLVDNYQRMYSTKSLPVRTLIVDTKPRFKAAMELNGLTTGESGRYKKWDIVGSGVIPGSYVLPRNYNIRSELDQVWKFGGTTAIVQSESKSEWNELIGYVKEFYEGYGSKFPRLIVVDELADFYEQRVLSDIFQRISRNGRERDCAFIAGSQRPRKIPLEVMTEMLRLYMFELDYEEDIEHIVQFGLPWRHLRKQELSSMMPTDHAFFLWDRKLKFKSPSNQYYVLDL